MRALLLIGLLLPSLAFGQATDAGTPEVSDAPVAKAVHVGDVMSTDGVFLSIEDAGKLYRLCKTQSLENTGAQNEVLHPSGGWTPTTGWIVGGVVVSVGVGVLVGFLAFHHK